MAEGSPDGPQEAQSTGSEGPVTPSYSETVLEHFKTCLVNALAGELDMLRAPREDWGLAAYGIMLRMGIKTLPEPLRVHGVDRTVVFDLQEELPIPEVPRVGHDDHQG